jgi:hypothetical protein
MKVNVIKNEHGKVVATFEEDAPGGPSLRPVLKPGYRVEQVDAAEDYAADLGSFYQRHSDATE